MDFGESFEGMLEHVCGLCNKIFKKESKLDRHILQHHDLTSENIESLQVRKNNEDPHHVSTEDVTGDVTGDGTEDCTEDGIEYDTEDCTEYGSEDVIEDVIEDGTEEGAADDSEKGTKSELKDEFLSFSSMTNVKVHKMNQKYNNMFGFDPINRIWICAACGANFMSDHGMRNHLNVTKCGFGEKEDYKPKYNYKSFYIREEGRLTCRGCEAVYQSEHGIYYHLRATKCGFGEKDGPTPKKDYEPFYKVENNIPICLVCRISYDSMRGMYHHLDKKCGAEAKWKVSKPKNAKSEGMKRSPGSEKKDYKQFYRKEENSTFTCLGCETVYYSSHGMNSHLNITKCGFGDKFRSPPKTCYLRLYKKDGEQYICLGCGKIYGSQAGVHSHLKTTKCGFGDKENMTRRKNYTSVYTRGEEGGFTCNNCGLRVEHMYIIHKHIKKCVPRFMDDHDNLAAVKRVVEKMTDVKAEKMTGLIEEVKGDVLHKQIDAKVEDYPVRKEYMDVPLE